MTPFWAVVILLVLFAMITVIALYARSQHIREQQPPPVIDPRRTDTELMPRINANEWSTGICRGCRQDKDVLNGLVVQHVSGLGVAAGTSVCPGSGKPPGRKQK